MAEFPFRFYGACPSDWEAGFPPYLVRFQSEPAPATRAEIESVVAGAMAGVGLGDATRWDERTALFVFDERVADWDQFFEDVHAAMRAAHAISEIEEVVFLNANPEADEPWEAWSVAQQPQPTPGPRFGFECPFD